MVNELDLTDEDFEDVVNTIAALMSEGRVLNHDTNQPIYDVNDFSYDSSYILDEEFEEMGGYAGCDVIDFNSYQQNNIIKLMDE